MAGLIAGIDWMAKIPIGGTYTAVSADDSAGKAVISTGKADAVGFIVQVFRNEVNIANDVKVTLTAGVLEVKDGSTYKVTAADKINWIVF